MSQLARSFSRTRRALRCPMIFIGAASSAYFSLRCRMCSLGRWCYGGSRSGRIGASFIYRSAPPATANETESRPIPRRSGRREGCKSRAGLRRRWSKSRSCRRFEHRIARVRQCQSRRDSAKQRCQGKRGDRKQPNPAANVHRRFPPLNFAKHLVGQGQ